jgi:hypothetical protein
MRILERFVETPLAGTIGWSLLHSLWEGAFIAIVLAALLSVIRSPRAPDRRAWQRRSRSPGSERIGGDREYLPNNLLTLILIINTCRTTKYSHRPIGRLWSFSFSRGGQNHNGDYNCIPSAKACNRRNQATKPIVPRNASFKIHFEP